MTQKHNKHQWSALCDERGDQIEDFIICDLCRKIVRMHQVSSLGNGNIISGPVVTAAKDCWKDGK